MSRIVRVVEIGGAGVSQLDIDLDNPKVAMVPERIKFPGLEALLELIEERLPENTTGVAYSVAGPIEDHDKIIIAPQIHGLDGVNLATLTENRTKLQSAVFNDMEAAVTGMAYLLSGNDYFLGITWSSGIGARVWANGRILSLNEEVGHMVLDSSPFAPLCGCGKRGHVEAIIGGHAIKRRVIIETDTLQIKIPKEMHPCKFLDEAFDRKERWAVDLYRLVGEGMGIFLANIQTLLCLPLVVWKGTFAKAALKRVEPVIRTKMRRVLIDPSWEGKMKFEFSPEPADQDSLIGAAKALESLVLKDS